MKLIQDKSLMLSLPPKLRKIEEKLVKFQQSQVAKENEALRMLKQENLEKMEMAKSMVMASREELQKNRLKASSLRYSYKMASVLDRERKKEKEKFIEKVISKKTQEIFLANSAILFQDILACENGTKSFEEEATFNGIVLYPGLLSPEAENTYLEEKAHQEKFNLQKSLISIKKRAENAWEEKRNREKVQRQSRIRQKECLERYSESLKEDQAIEKYGRILRRQVEQYIEAFQREAGEQIRKKNREEFLKEREKKKKEQMEKLAESKVTQKSKEEWEEEAFLRKTKWLETSQVILELKEKKQKKHAESCRGILEHILEIVEYAADSIKKDKEGLLEPGIWRKMTKKFIELSPLSEKEGIEFFKSDQVKLKLENESNGLEFSSKLLSGDWPHRPVNENQQREASMRLGNYFREIDELANEVEEASEAKGGTRGIVKCLIIGPKYSGKKQLGKEIMEKFEGSRFLSLKRRKENQRDLKGEVEKEAELIRESGGSLLVFWGLGDEMKELSEIEEELRDLVSTEKDKEGVTSSSGKIINALWGSSLSRRLTKRVKNQSVFDLVIKIEGNQPTIQKRAAGRQIDPETQVIYHPVKNPPSKKDSKLQKRLKPVPDDGWKASFHFYDSNSSEINSFYSKLGVSEYFLWKQGASSFESLSERVQPLIEKKLQEKNQETIESARQDQRQHSILTISQFSQIEKHYFPLLLRSEAILKGQEDHINKQLHLMQRGFIGILADERQEDGIIMRFARNYNKFVKNYKEEAKTAEAIKELQKRLRETHDDVWDLMVSKKKKADGKTKEFLEMGYCQKESSTLVGNYEKMVYNEVHRFIYVSNAVLFSATGEARLILAIDPLILTSEAQSDSMEVVAKGNRFEFPRIDYAKKKIEGFFSEIESEIEIVLSSSFRSGNSRFRIGNEASVEDIRGIIALEKRGCLTRIESLFAASISGVLRLQESFDRMILQCKHWQKSWLTKKNQSVKRCLSQISVFIEKTQPIDSDWRFEDTEVFSAPALIGLIEFQVLLPLPSMKFSRNIYRFNYGQSLLILNYFFKPQSNTAMHRNPSHQSLREQRQNSNKDGMTSISHRKSPGPFLEGDGGEATSSRGNLFSNGLSKETSPGAMSIPVLQALCARGFLPEVFETFDDFNWELFLRRLDEVSGKDGNLQVLVLFLLEFEVLPAQVLESYFERLMFYPTGVITRDQFLSVIFLYFRLGFSIQVLSRGTGETALGRRKYEQVVRRQRVHSLRESGHYFRYGEHHYRKAEEHFQHWKSKGKTHWRKFLQCSDHGRRA